MSTTNQLSTTTQALHSRTEIPQHLLDGAMESISQAITELCESVGDGKIEPPAVSPQQIAGASLGEECDSGDWAVNLVHVSDSADPCVTVLDDETAVIQRFVCDMEAACLASDLTLPPADCGEVEPVGLTKPVDAPAGFGAKSIQKLCSPEDQSLQLTAEFKRIEFELKQMNQPKAAGHRVFTSPQFKDLGRLRESIVSLLLGSNFRRDQSTREIQALPGVGKTSFTWDFSHIWFRWRDFIDDANVESPVEFTSHLERVAWEMRCDLEKFHQWCRYVRTDVLEQWLFGNSSFVEFAIQDGPKLVLGKILSTVLRRRILSHRVGVDKHRLVNFWKRTCELLFSGSTEPTCEVIYSEVFEIFDSLDSLVAKTNHLDEIARHEEKFADSLEAIAARLVEIGGPLFRLRWAVETLLSIAQERRKDATGKPAARVVAVWVPGVLPANAARIIRPGTMIDFDLELADNAANLSEEFSIAFCKTLRTTQTANSRVEKVALSPRDCELRGQLGRGNLKGRSGSLAAQTALCLARRGRVAVDVSAAPTTVGMAPYVVATAEHRRNGVAEIAGLKEKIAVLVEEGVRVLIVARSQEKQARKLAPSGMAVVASPERVDQLADVLLHNNLIAAVDDPRPNPSAGVNRSVETAWPEYERIIKTTVAFTAKRKTRRSSRAKKTRRFATPQPVRTDRFSSRRASRESGLFKNRDAESLRRRLLDTVIQVQELQKPFNLVSPKTLVSRRFWPSGASWKSLKRWSKKLWTSFRSFPASLLVLNTPQNADFRLRCLVLLAMFSGVEMTHLIDLLPVDILTPDDLISPGELTSAEITGESIRNTQGEHWT